MTTAKPSILVWDLPVRLFQGLLILSFAGAWLTAESEHWRLLHVTLGYTLVGVHILGVLIASRLQHENLAASMLTGRKADPPDQAIRSAKRSVAALMLAVVLGFWWLQWTGASNAAAVTGPGSNSGVSSNACAANPARLVGAEQRGRHGACACARAND
jgi:hypothetical protein